MNTATMERLEFRAMGSHMLAGLDSESPEAAGQVGKVPEWFEAWEQRLSRFRDDSDLSVLNRQGRVEHADPVLWEVLRLAMQAARATGGLINPAMLTNLEAAGYDRTFDALRDTQAVSRTERAETSLIASRLPEKSGDDSDEPAWERIRINPATRSIALPPGVRVDLGGVAKGWAADKAAHRLGKHGPALVDAGGDIAVSGPMTGGRGWPVGISDPTLPERQLELLEMSRGGVATSGRDYRRWKKGDAWMHHIIDPRTGRPANTDVLSATVVGPSATQAEIAAKVTLILGSKEGRAWLETRQDLAGLLVLENGRVLHSRGFDAWLWK